MANIVGFKEYSYNHYAIVMTSPCYVCGADSVVEGLCATCYDKAHPLAHIDTPLNISSCKRCGALQVPGGWQVITESYESPEELSDQLTKKVVFDEIKLLHQNVAIEIETLNRLDRVLEVEIVAFGESHPALTPHEERLPVQIRFNYKICETCGMMSGGYYEAILQIRGDDRVLSDEEAQEMVDLTTRLTIDEYGKDIKAFITEISRNRYGIDFRIGSYHLAKKIADEIQRSYLATRKESYTLVTQERGGKGKYRTTILLRLPHFTVGDFISVDNRPCQILSIGHGSLGCYDLVERNRFSINQKSAKWQTIEYLAQESERVEYSIVTEGYEQPYILMNTGSFKTIEVDREVLDTSSSVGDLVYLFHYEDKVYVLP